MFEDNSFFDIDRLPSETVEDAEMSVSDHDSPPRDHQYETSQFENDFASQFRQEEDAPIPSIEIGNIDRERSVGMSVTPELIEVDHVDRERSIGMFITPEPGLRYSTPISISDTPGSICQSNAYNMQVSEDDCMVVDEGECSIGARKKWATLKPKQKIPDKVAIIKKEPGFEPPRSSDVLEIQRRLIARHNAAQKRKSGASKLFGWTRPKDVSPTPGTKSKPRRGSNYQQRNLDIVDVKVEFENLMRRGEDNSGWMEQSDNEYGENEEIENLKTLRQSLEKRKQDKHLTEVETIELMKINQQIELHGRRQLAVDRLNRQESISSDDGEDEAEHQLRLNLNNQVAKEDESAKKGRRKSTKGRGRKVAKTAREVAENRRKKEREKERKKRARAAISKKGPLKGKGSKAQKAIRPKEHKSRMKMTRDEGEAALGTILQGLVHNDFIADRQAQGEFPDAPNIHETRKDKALHALLASVPDDYDTHRAKTDKSDLHKASKNFGFGRVKFDKGGWKLKGMRSHLYHHQLIGADWMLSRELTTEAPHGGLLADAMGLGKTLQTLATMVGNPPGKDDLKAKMKATLIVMPASAIRQWMDEIEVHVEPGTFPRIMHYRAKNAIPLIFLQDCDIVLTSYAEVMNSFPWPSAEELKEISKQGGLHKWMEECQEPAGNLHKVTWYRVVLDEAHAIKNFKSRTSIACQFLCAQYRWALSGTPIQNRLDELFPYLRFLRAPWTENRDLFRRHFCDPDAAEANARVSVILSIVMRRTMKDKILGRPIVELPPIHPDTQFISFSKEEWVLYKILEDRFRANLNEHFEQGTAQKNYAQWMVQILRLRQCTSHPFLLESTVKEIFTFEDILRLKAEWKQLSGNKQPLYEQIQQWVQQTEEERLAAQAKGDPTLGPGDKQAFGRSDFGRYFRMENFLVSLDSKDLVKRVVCRICGDLPEDPLITDCHHVFCRTCLENYLKAEELRDDNFEYDQCPEPSCRKIFKDARPFNDGNLPDDEDVGTDDSGNPSRNNRSRKRGKRGSEDDLHSGSSTWFDTCMETEDKYLPPSAKTIALKAKILNWINEAPTDKIIIFTQWKVMAKILGAICNKESWPHLFFTGDMNLEQRHASVKKFHTDPEYKIMIASLKCGGQALNLTCANRVISIDLWWNHSIEQQAFGRVFRIGQHKETYVSRFVIKNTVDKRLLSMQADKIRTIDRAMQDTDGDIVEPLSMTDLAGLFGHLRETEDGKLRVERDYEEEDGDEESQGSGSDGENMEN